MVSSPSPQPTAQLDVAYRQFVSSQPTVPTDWQANGNHTEMTLHVQQVESLAILLNEWAFSPIQPTVWSADQLQQLGDAFCRQVTYLLEPLRVVEFDPNASSLQARSTQPSMVGNQRSYFELSLSPRSATLRRFSAQPGAPRQQQEMQLTHEVVQRLLVDMEQIVGAL